MEKYQPLRAGQLLVRHRLGSVPEVQVNKHALIIMCASCRKIKGAGGVWIELVSQKTCHSAGKFSHSICPACSRRLYPEFFEPVDPEDSTSGNE